jgi:hypothetical protein
LRELRQHLFVDPQVLLAEQDEAHVARVLCFFDDDPNATPPASSRVTVDEQANPKGPGLRMSPGPFSFRGFADASQGPPR